MQLNRNKIIACHVFQQIDHGTSDTCVLDRDSILPFEICYQTKNSHRYNPMLIDRNNYKYILLDNLAYIHSVLRKIFNTTFHCNTMKQNAGLTTMKLVCAILDQIIKKTCCC